MIRSFAFADGKTGWRLEETSFGNLNLLVGPSGAGKTRILDALRHVRGIVDTGTHNSWTGKWSLVAEALRDNYKWEVEIEDGRFVRELVTRNGDENLVDRVDVFFFNGKELPPLEETRSAVKLLHRADAIKPFYQAISQWHFLETSIAELRFDLREWAVAPFDGQLDPEGLKEAGEVPVLVRAYLLRKTPEFAELRDRYREIFPTVEDLWIGTFPEFEGDVIGPDHIVTAGVREAGVGGWIEASSLSSGMLKVLYYLIELALTPPESVLFIDELENSLGVNCLPDLSEELVRKSGEVQFIITSHHPQVINTITPEHWKLVTRQGSVVTVRDAKTIPALHTASPLQKFTQLINLPEYAEGVA